MARIAYPTTPPPPNTSTRLSAENFSHRSPASTVLLRRAAETDPEAASLLSEHPRKRGSTPWHLSSELQKSHGVPAVFLTILRVAKSLECKLDQSGVRVLVGQTRHPLRHHQNKGSIIHVQPITAPNELVVGVARERAIKFTTKIGLIKTGRERWSNDRPIRYQMIPFWAFYLHPQPVS
jgi:hypothetical protein